MQCLGALEAVLELMDRTLKRKKVYGLANCNLGGLRD